MEIMREINDGYNITSPKDAYKYLDEFKNQDREMFIVIGLDTKNKPCYREINSIGTLNAILVHPREVFKKAIMMSCESIIIAHNHPSGDTEPSPEDLNITKKLKECGELLSIKLLDSIIITKNVEENRIQLFYDGKPSEEVRSKLKSWGFRWTPSKCCWQRFLNNNSRYATKQVLKMEVEE